MTTTLDAPMNDDTIRVGHDVDDASRRNESITWNGNSDDANNNNNDNNSSRSSNSGSNNTFYSTCDQDGPTAEAKIDDDHSIVPTFCASLAARNSSTASTSSVPRLPSFFSSRKSERIASNAIDGGSGRDSPILTLRTSERNSSRPPMAATALSVEQQKPQAMNGPRHPQDMEGRSQGEAVQDHDDDIIKNNKKPQHCRSLSDVAEDVPVREPLYGGVKRSSTATKGRRLSIRTRMEYESGLPLDSNQKDGDTGHEYRGKDNNSTDLDNRDGVKDSVDDDDDDDDSERRPETRLWKARIVVGRMVNHERVQITIISLIVLNAMMMGLGTMDFVTDSPNVQDIFNKVDLGFLTIFTAEVVMQFFYLGVALFQDGWLTFDFLLVAISWSVQSIQIIRAFRIFRVLRLITRVKPLRGLVLAIGQVLPRMYAIAVLLMIIFYVFAVLFTELFSELPLAENYFRTLDASLFSCMEMMTLGWADIAREVIVYEPWAWAPFSIFIAISGFIVYNLIVAVVVEAVAVTEQNVRALDGLDPDSPEEKLENAKDRIDLLQCHIEDMVRTQTQVQKMIEVLASELLHLETERMKSEQRETLLRNEMTRKLEYERNMESKQQIESLERTYVLERERRESQRRMKMLPRQNSRDELDLSLHGVSVVDGINQPSSEGDPVTRRSRTLRRGSTGLSSRRSGSNQSLMSQRNIASREDATDSRPPKDTLGSQHPKN
jgi:hypothetical protein